MQAWFIQYNRDRHETKMMLPSTVMSYERHRVSNEIENWDAIET